MVDRERYLASFNAVAEIAPQIYGNRPDRAIRWQPSRCTEPEPAMPARLSQDIVTNRRVEQPLRLVNTDVTSMACQVVPKGRLMEIYHATENNDLASLKRLLKLLPPTLLARDINTLFQSVFPGKPPMLIHACLSNARSIVEYLIQFGFDVNIPHAGGGTALHFACASGHTGMVKLLLDSNAQVHYRGEKCSSPLGHAVKSRKTESVRLLLHAGAGIEEGNGHGDESLLEKACGKCKTTPEIVGLLLERGADPSHGGGRILAKALTYASAEIVQMLLSAGAEIGFVSTTWEVQLEEARVGGYMDITYMDMVEKTQLLDEHCTSSVGCNEHPIIRAFQIQAGIQAIRDGNVLQFDQIMRSNHPVDAVARYQATLRVIAAAYTLRYRTRLLGDAASWPNLEMAEFLLQQGLDPNEQDGSGRTALMSACLEDNEEATALLLRHGAATQIADKGGSTPLSEAARRNYVSIVKMLLAAGACVHGSGAMAIRSPLQAACNSRNGHSSFLASDNLEIVRALVAGGADVNAGPGPLPPLESALAWGPAGVVEILLDAGAVIDNCFGWPGGALKRLEGLLGPVQLGQHLIMDAKEKLTAIVTEHAM
ncbi:Transient receptor putative cation channel sub A member 1 [Vermiconidia calcicola]|uniref:Transient receptor putative cation channel sub A member 1 n=1 Tax=Vermiconidia calcicola TaxID=1690605 RepID=A0ACC3NZ92_9PEZI|nr:Transient receptor putative cation channel sub A member 1 [Vermiconidia calcicola]